MRVKKNHKLVNFLIDRELFESFHEVASAKHTNATALIRAYVVREVKKYQAKDNTLSDNYKENAGEYK
jgi:hypothetical protein